MKKRFGELPVGARFEFRGRRYEKISDEIGRDEERGGNVFQPGTEVVCDVSGGASAQPKVEAVVSSDRRSLTVRVSVQQEEDLATGWVRPLHVWRPRPRSKRTRLGREPGRELRPYGTL